MEKCLVWDVWQEKNARFSMLKGEKQEFGMEKGIESDARQEKNARFSMLKGEKQGFSMEKGIESDDRQAKNARFSMLNGEKWGFSMKKVLDLDPWPEKNANISMLKGEKQKFGMEKRVKLPVDHIDLQAEGPKCPFGLLFAPCRRAKGMSQGSAARTRRTGASFTSPEHCGTRARRATRENMHLHFAL